MPSRTKKQAKTMAAAAHNPAFAKKAGIPPSVAKDFNAADQKTGILKSSPKSPRREQSHSGRPQGPNGGRGPKFGRMK